MNLSDIHGYDRPPHCLLTLYLLQDVMLEIQPTIIGLNLV